MTSYSIGLHDGVVHIRAAFENRSIADTNFRWRTSFVLFRTTDASRELRWGVWNGVTVLTSLDRLEAIAYVEALLDERHYIAETAFGLLHGYSDESYAVVLPPDLAQRIDLSATDVEILGKQLDVLREASA